MRRAVVLALTLTGCSAEEPPCPQPTAVATAVPPDVAAPPIRPALDVRPVTAGAATRVAGELACAWQSPNGATLLLARADVGKTARAQAVIDIGGSPVVLRGAADGGFAALEGDGSFAGAGTRASVVRGDRIATGTEESHHAATLTIARAGVEWRGEGEWRCGP